MAEESKQGMKKSERVTRASLVRKTGSLVGKSKAPTGNDQSDDEENGGLTVSRQASIPFVSTGSKTVRKKASNSQLKVVSGAERRTASPAPGNADDRAKSVTETPSVRSAQSAMLGATSKLQDAAPSTGPPPGETLVAGSSVKSKSKMDSASIKFTQSALLGQAASQVQDASRKTSPLSAGDTAPSASNADKTTSGTASARSIKSTLPSRLASTKTSGAVAITSPSFNGTPQDPSGQNEKPMLDPMSLKSIQPASHGPEASAASSQQGTIIVLSEKDRKLRKGSEDHKLGRIGSAPSAVSQFGKDGKIDARSQSQASLKITSQRLASSVSLRSSKTPGLESSMRAFLSAHGQSVSQMGLADGSTSTVTGGSRRSSKTTKYNESIRLLASKLSAVKADSRPELDLQTRMEMCPCPDMKAEYEDEYEEEEEQKQFLESIRSSVKSKQSSQLYRRSIRNVERSPFERKDRAARQEFLNELEQMEIAEIKRKQKLKPRKMKKYLKKEGVYQTIKTANFIPDSQSDGSRGHPSVCSIATYGEGEHPEPSPSSSTVSVEESDEDKDRTDRFQLRKDQSVGSRTAGQLLREEAFLEIELSEADDVDPTPRSSVSLSSSSATEVLSSSSEISLRVNLEKAHLPADKKKIKARNAPYLTYKNKIDAEIQAAAKKSSHEGSSQENLIIEKIATEFGEWAKENGLKPEAVEKDIIKELFQFGTMDTAANSIAVEIKELVIVPETITEGLYPELEERAALYRQILWDEMAYWKKERSMAFGKPDPFPYKRPLNEPLPLWTKSGFVPLPLSTGELLYQSLINNESLMLERYVLWMVENPKYHRPPYLIKSGYFQKIVDKHGGKEDVIRQRSQAAKHLVNSTGKNLAGLNIGMKTELRKLKEMAKADITVQSTRKAR